ncbi:MAG: hypothetical protein ACWGO1_05875 [Anaerolineales bacterium]
MKRLSLLVLVFAVVSVVFFLLLVFLRVPFPPYPLMSWQDAIDILTPLVLLPLYWLMFKFASRLPSSLWQEVAFMLLVALLASGHGMHLAANSIDNLIGSLAERGVIDVHETGIYTLTYFYDELLSHFLRDIGLLLLPLLLIYREWQDPAGERTTWWSVILAGILYGFTIFLVTLEGNTVILGLTFAALVVLFTLFWGRGKLSSHPLLAFFFVTSLVALLLFTGWGLYWKGFPPPSGVGLI